MCQSRGPNGSLHINPVPDTMLKYDRSDPEHPRQPGHLASPHLLANSLPNAFLASTVRVTASLFS